MHKNQGTELSVTCTVCNQLFPDIRATETHLLESHKICLCIECKKQFSTRGNFCAHKQEVHDDDTTARQNTGKYVCKYCGKTFRNRSRLSLHEQKHSDGRPFNCEYCQKTYKHKKNLDCHVRNSHKTYSEGCQT